MWLRELRVRLRLRQDQVEAHSATIGESCRISQSYLSKLERGTKTLSSLTPQKMNALRLIYRVSPEEWASHTGLSVVTGHGEDDVVGGLEFVRVPVHALAAAGLPLSEDGSSIIDTELVPREEFKNGMVVLEVQGESMTSSDGGLRHGDRIYVDVNDLELREGKVYVLHVQGGGILVKRVRRFDGDFWLTSDNPEFPPIRPDQVTLVGRVYYHQPRGRRL